MAASAYDEVLTGRAGLEGVRRLLYGRATREALRAELGLLLAPDATLGRCRLERAKFKPGRKLTGYYFTEVAAGSTPSVRGVAVTWALDRSAPKVVAGEDAMQDEAVATGVAEPFVALRGQTPTFSLQVAPLDAAFPQLVRLSAPGYVTGLLADADPGAAAAAYTVSTVRYRPRQRHVLCYAPVDPGAPIVFAKLYRHGGATWAVRVANAVADRIERAGHGAAAARPLPARPADDVVLFRQLQGVPLARQLWRGHAVPARQLALAGELLRGLHEGDPPEVDLGTDDLAGQVAATARAAEHLEPLLPQAAALIADLLDRARELDALLPTEAPSLVHADFKADHIWVSRHGLTLLDFDSCCLAEPALDVGKFLADLGWWYAIAGRPGAEEAQRHFLAGYAASYGPIPPERLARARLYAAVVLTRIIVRRLRRFKPEWGRRTTALLPAAVAAMDVAAGQTSTASGAAAS